MKRTGEVILTTSGLILSFIGTVIVTIILFFSNTDALKDMIIEGAMEEELALNIGELERYFDFFINLGWVVIGILLISIILAAISIYLFIGNKKPVAAGIIAIIAAVLVTIGTVFSAFVPGILYLIAGIMGLVRRPRVTNEQNLAESDLQWDQNKSDGFN